VLSEKQVKKFLIYSKNFFIYSKHANLRVFFLGIVVHIVH